MDDELSIHCFMHFWAADIANAAIHTSAVRYSPITFRLAEVLVDTEVSGVVEYALENVLNHLGTYEEDPGRAADTVITDDDLDDDFLPQLQQRSSDRGRETVGGTQPAATD